METILIDWRNQKERDADAELIRSIVERGGLIVFPTETVFGIGGNAFSDEACRRIFKAKGRPPDNPLIVHVSSYEMAGKVAEIPARIIPALKKLWPGPLTVIMRNRGASTVATAGLDTVAVRMPAGPDAAAMVEFAGVPVAAPSANMATRPSITRNEDAVSQFMGRTDAILLGEEPEYGIESTVIDVSGDFPVIMRPGAYTIDDISSAFGHAEYFSGYMEKPSTPGMKYRHYSPSKPLYLIRDEERFINMVSSITGNFVPICSDRIGRSLEMDYISLGNDSDMYNVAKRLFAAMNEFDNSSYSEAYIHGFPENGIGYSIMNRIKKASVEI